MSKAIRFYGVEDLPEGGFSCRVRSFDHADGQEETLTFAMSPRPDVLDDDAIAITLSTLCGPVYAEVEMDLAVSAACAHEIESFTGAKVSFREVVEKEPRPVGETRVLSFSGGFDSLAALAVMPESTRLVSIDFGGQFSREADSYRRFDTCVLTTNIQKLGYCRNSWTFMGAAMTLFAGHLQAGYGAFGGILEASWLQFSRNGALACRTTTQPFSGLGIRRIGITNGLTEVGTALVAAKYYFDIIDEALTSLAPPRTEKSYRKYLLLKAVNERFGLNLQLSEREAPVRPPVVFGRLLHCDFLCLYVLKHISREEASKTVDRIPVEVDEFVKRHTLDFYERVNTNFLASIPSADRGRYFSRLLGAGVLPYDENDWRELDEVCAFLATWHPELRRAGSDATLPGELRSRLQQASAEILDLREQVRRLEAENGSVRDELTKDRDRAESVRARIEDARARAQDRCESLVRELGVAHANLVQANADLEHAQMALAQMRAEHQRSVAESARAVREMREKLAIVQQSYTRAKSDYQKMKAWHLEVQQQYRKLSEAKLGRLTLRYWGIKDRIKARLARRPGGRTLPARHEEPADPVVDLGVTVIIPTYRPTPLVEQAVDSVLKQDLPRNRLQILLCVNGPDADYGKSLERRYRSVQEVTVLYTPEKGPNAGRRIGIRHATMPLLTFLDDDDLFTPGFLRTLANGFGHPDVNVAAGRLVDLDEATGAINAETYFNRALQHVGKGRTQDFLAAGSLFASFCEKMYRTSFLREKLGEPAMDEGHSEDVIYWAEKFGRLEGSLYIADPAGKEAYVRRLSKNSLSRPDGEREYAFYVTDRLAIISRMAAIMFDASCSRVHKLFLHGKIKSQTAIMSDYVRTLPDDEHARALREIRSCPCAFLNQSLFSDRVAIAFCHNFSPSVDASSFVATKRLREIDGIEGEPLQWHVVTQDMRKIRTLDQDFQRFYADFVSAEQITLNTSFGFEPAGQLAFAEEAFRRVAEVDAEVIYSRALFVGSHIAASKYKQAHPHVKWYAEFSDPHAYGVDDKPRPCRGTPTWLDIEQLVYAGADVILFTNRNQMEYMLSYNPRPELNDSIRRRALIRHHPVLPHVYCGLVPVAYDLDPEKINIGFFGTFYVTRKTDDMLALLHNPKVVLHVFTTKPDELREQVAQYGDQIRVNPVVSHFEFLNLGARLDYLFLNDTAFPGKINPFLPSKFGDYLVTETRIIAKVQPGSTLSEETHPLLIKVGEITRDFAMGLEKRNVERL